uniref:Retrotransposon gag domain-containing protein n=1 Tax=Hyaloperonospora arabidopsidis (strain Emoy2) TaxID=559515 RepID=M4BEL5_HYAAE
MRSGLIKLDHQQVSLAISKLDGRAREWALTCITSVDLVFSTWESLKSQLVQVFSPPNQAYRVRSRFLSTRQEPKSFGFTPTFEEAVRIALNAEHNLSRLELAGMGTTLALREQTTRVLRTVIGRNRWTSAKDEGEVELQAAEQQRITAPGYESTLYPDPEVWHDTGKCRYPVKLNRA